MTTNLETFFSSISLPATLRLSEYEYINDLPKCIQSHLSFIKNRGEKAGAPYEKRLLRIKTKIENELSTANEDNS